MSKKVVKEEEEKKEKKKLLKKEIMITVFAIIALIIFNSALYVSQITPHEAYNALEFISLVFLNPLIVALFGFIYSYKYGFSWFVPTILALCFLPSVMIFLKVDFLFYLPIYFIFGISSELCGISITNINYDEKKK